MTFYYVLLILFIVLRGYVENPYYYVAPVLLVYLCMALADHRKASFPSVKKTDKWLKTATYVEVTSWFMSRKTLLQDVEESINLAFVNTHAVIHKLTPYDFHVYYNDSGHFTQHVYRVYVVHQRNILMTNYLISCDTVDGVNCSKQFHAFATQMSKKKYYVKPRREYINLDDNHLMPFVDASEGTIDECIRRSLAYIDNHQTAVGLRILLNLIEDNKQYYYYLVARYKVVPTLERIAFDSLSNEDDWRLMAITALRLLSEDKNMLVGLFSQQEYVNLAKPLFEHKSGPYNSCHYFHGMMDMDRAKKLVNHSGQPGYYMIFALDYDFNNSILICYHAVNESPFNFDTKRTCTTRKITYNEDKHLFFIEGKPYKSVDDYVSTIPTFHFPYVRPVKPILIAMESLDILKRVVSYQ